jgi:hypothetical protein
VPVTGRGRARARASAFLLALAACANVQDPPGGPPDAAPPRLVATTPESLSVRPGFSGEVSFQFDEVIAEGTASTGTGTSELERLIILSPSTRVPNVRWRRTRIGVEPREGWRPNTVYRIELLPGVGDLRQNRSREGRVITFTTGAPLPTAALRGTAYDWTTGQPARGAVVEAVPAADSFGYRTTADSSGRFELAPLPAGEYVVYASTDQNRNLRREPREAYDTARVATADTAARPELWIFPHDTIGPRIQTVAVLDSLGATLQFNQPLDPTTALDTANVRVRALPDSIPVRVVSLLPQRLADSLARAERAAPADPAPGDSAGADSAAAPARADTVPAAKARPGVRPPPARARPGRRAAPADTGRAGAPPAKAADTAAPRPGRAAADTAAPRRPPLETRLVLRVAEPWRPGGRYVIDVLGARNVNRVASDTARAVLAVPERPRPAADSVGADSLRADSVGADSLPADSAAPAAPAAPRADSLRAPADTTRPAPGRSDSLPARPAPPRRR